MNTEMCEPTTLMIASAVVGVGSTLYAGAAQANAYEAEAKINAQNAILADRRAKDAIERGQFEEERKKREGTLLRKEQENSFAASNIDFGFGSALDIITSSAMAAQMDASIIRMNAEREAEDFEMQAHNQRNSQSMNKSAASGARIGSIFAAAGTALDGGAGVFKYNAATGKTK